jgi:hypothetical protein
LFIQIGMIPSIFVTLFYYNIFLFSMSLLCSSCIFDIVLISNDDFHMFVKRLVQYSSGLGGRFYVSAVLRYYIYLRMLSNIRERIVDRRCDRPVESLCNRPFVHRQSRARSRRMRHGYA